MITYYYYVRVHEAPSGGTTTAYKPGAFSTKGASGCPSHMLETQRQAGKWDTLLWRKGRPCADQIGGDAVAGRSGASSVS